MSHLLVFLASSQSARLYLAPPPCVVGVQPHPTPNQKPVRSRDTDGTEKHPGTLVCFAVTRAQVVTEPIKMSSKRLEHNYKIIYFSKLDLRQSHKRGLL